MSITYEMPCPADPAAQCRFPADLLPRFYAAGFVPGMSRADLLPVVNRVLDGLGGGELGAGLVVARDWLETGTEAPSRPPEG